MGDEAIRKLGDKSVSILVDTTFQQAFPKEIVVMFYGKTDRPLASHKEDEGMMIVDSDKGLLTNKPARLFELAGVKPKHFVDARLIEVIDNIGHESGHAILAGVSSELSSLTRTDRTGKDATRAYLSCHPELGVTTNWISDVRTHEERFSQGYAKLVVDTTLEKLGYTEQERKSIATQLSKQMSTPLGGELGENQIDYLRNVDHETGLAQLVTIDDPHVLSYEGFLGYELALTPEQIKSQLQDLAEMCNTSYKPLEVDPKVWQWRVGMHRSPDIVTHLLKLERQRYWKLNRERVIDLTLKRAIIGIVGGLALSVAIYPNEYSNGFHNLKRKIFGSDTSTMQQQYTAPPNHIPTIKPPDLPPMAP